jgi:preprotein translocase subunit SecD
VATKPSRPGRTLAILAVVLAAMFAGVAAIGTWAPTLGLDLQGGTRITLSASAASSGGGVTSDKMNEAVDIIRNRVNGTGVTEASVTTQGGNNIVVEIPGQQRNDLVKQIGQTAQLRFRLVALGPTPARSKPGASSPSPTSPAAPTPSTSAGNPSPTSSPTGGSTPSSSPTGGSTPGSSPTAGSPTAGASSAPIKDPLHWQPDAAWQAKFNAFSCPARGAKPEVVDIPRQPLLACNARGDKYLLGPALIEGTQLTGASAGIPQGQTQWVVNLSFNGQASSTFATVTQQLFANKGLFAIVLDGVVLSSPGVNEPILNGQAQISGSFTQSSAQALANSLKYGALPLSFQTESVTEEGPQLAADSLHAGIVAGTLGLVLVVAYCLLYYRGLGLVVIASLVVAAFTNYAAVLLLSRSIGFTLTLPGIAGLIVAIGITADSFIVYFERLRDEVRDGKTLRSAVEAGWVRARMTILAADSVSFLAALVLFIVAIGVVKGFAFALGLTTLIDVFIVFFFTKPLVTLLARTEFFGGGHPMSGLDPKHLGVSRLPAVRRRRPVGETA